VVEQRPFGFDGLSIDGTAVVIEGFGSSYTLNVYQPFVFADRSDSGYVVDGQGQLWSTSFNGESPRFDSLDDGRQVLPMEVQPNPNLSHSFGR
jgi:hypothetical protein